MDPFSRCRHVTVCVPFLCRFALVTEWRYSSGFIDESMVKRHMPDFGEDVQIFMCGPPPMIKFACVPNLEKVGFTEKQYFAF